MILRMSLGVLLASSTPAPDNFKPRSTSARSAAAPATLGSAVSPRPGSPSPVPVASPLAPAAAPLRIAVLGLDAFGVQPDLRRTIGQLLEHSLRTISGVRVLSSLDLQLALEGTPDAEVLACTAGAECARRLGQALAVDWVVFGTLGGLGDSFSVTLRALRLTAPPPPRGRRPLSSPTPVRLLAREAARQKINLSGSRDQLIPEIRLAAFRLLAPEQIVGQLAVQLDLVGVHVWVDGSERGITPLPAALTGLAPGPHQVVLRHPGWPEVQRSLIVRPFETAWLRLAMQAASPAVADDR